VAEAWGLPAHLAIAVKHIAFDNPGAAEHYVTLQLNEIKAGDDIVDIGR